MNGITSTLQDEIKKNLDNKSKEKFKMLLMLVCSNLFVFILCFTFLQPQEKNKEKPIDKLILRPAHQWLVVPVQSLLIDNISIQSSEMIVSLYSTEKKLLAEKAYIHDLMKTEQGVQFFKFEINQNDIKNFTEINTSGVLVVPYVQSEIKKGIVSHNKMRGSTYEVDY